MSLWKALLYLYRIVSRHLPATAYARLPARERTNHRPLATCTDVETDGQEACGHRDSPPRDVTRPLASTRHSARHHTCENELIIDACENKLIIDARSIIAMQYCIGELFTVVLAIAIADCLIRRLYAHLSTSCTIIFHCRPSIKANKKYKNCISDVSWLVSPTHVRIQ